MNYTSGLPNLPSECTRQSFQGSTTHEMSILHSTASSNHSISASVEPLSHRKQALDRVDVVTPKDDKPVGRAKRLYATFIENLQALLRTLGLGIVSALRYRPSKSKTCGEPIKVALRHSRLTALLRTSIHVVPLGLTMWLIILNWNTYYVGSYVYNTFYYQVGAKVLEIMIQASLTVIMFSYIRYELVIGNGLPFGALFSGLQINQISYLWSKEFWGSLTSRHLPLKHKIYMLSMILICFILAAAAGPSSATLLIPRLDYWPAGEARVWIDATSEQLWPHILDTSVLPSSHQCSLTSNIPWSDGCPSSEWEAAFLWFFQEVDALPPQFRPYPINHQKPESVQVTGKSSIRQLITQQAIISWQVHSESQSLETIFSGGSYSTTQHASVADVLTSTAALWSSAVNNIKPAKGHGAPLFDEQEAMHTLDNSYQPYVATTCGVDTIQGSNDQMPVRFPIIPSPIASQTNFSVFLNGVQGRDYPLLKKAQMLELTGSKTDNRFKWIQLSSDYYNQSTLGLVIIRPPLVNTSHPERNIQEAMFCTIQAGWGLSTISVSTTGASSSTVTSVPNVKGLSNVRGTSEDYSEIQRATGSTETASYFETQQAPLAWVPDVYPSIPITITPEWAEYINPTHYPDNETILNLILQSFYVSNPDARDENDGLWELAQEVLSLLMANAISRVSFNRTLQGLPKTVLGPNGIVEIDGTAWFSGKQDIFNVTLEETRMWTEFTVTSTIKGYAYNTHGFGPNVAIAFLLIYCTVASAHVFYSGISGISSTAWDSIAEVTALAMNSTPTVALRNTCAGITEMHIFRIPVRVLAFRDTEGESEHLEMVFGHELSEDDKSRTIKANRTYGTLPAWLKKME